MKLEPSLFPSPRRSRYSFGPAALVLAVLCATPVSAQQTLDQERTWSTLLGTSPAQGEQGAALDAPIALRFSLAVDGSTVDDSSFIVSVGGQPIPMEYSISLNRRTVWANFVDIFPPPETQVDVLVDGNVMLDSFGRPVDADRDGALGGTHGFFYFTGVGAPLDTAPATLTGFVTDENGLPLAGVEVDAVFYPSDEGEPPLNQPGVTDANGEFVYQTVDITGQQEFLVRVRLAGHSENLEVVTLLAGSCWRINDSKLVPLSPKQTVPPGQDVTICDPTGQVELFFPDGAINAEMQVSITVLPDAGFLRDELPQLVSSAGFFTDIAGVFGDETQVPVTLRIPNTHGLPPGTQVQIGKIDHNTLEWVDMREAYDGPPPAPDYIGVVSPDGTMIEVDFDHFCSVCTGYCLPVPCDEPKPFPRPDCPPPDPDGPDGPGPNPPVSWSCGNSLITLREGHLFEWIELPGFTELGEPWGLKLGYASFAAKPTVRIALGVDFLGTRPVERTIFSFTVEGITKEAAYGKTSNDLQPRGIWFWDGRDFLGNPLPTGSYQYEAHATSLNNGLKVALPNPDKLFGDSFDLEFSNLDYPDLIPQRTAPIQDRVVVLNLTDSNYGAGWSVANESRLHADPDGCLVQVYGAVGWRRFEPDPLNPQAWLPGDDLSLIVRDATDGSYTRTLVDGSVESYTTDGDLQTIITRDGYVTTYVYGANDQLALISSPTGFSYSLSYDGSGKLSQVSDSAGRTTSFVVDMSGDLVSVTDVASSVRTFEYDVDHRMTAQNGPRGERTEYDFQNTRVVEARAYDTDGTTLLRRRQFSPSELEGEMGQAILDGQGSLALPIPPTEGDADETIDGNGRVSRHYTDTLSRTVRQTDPLGRDVQFAYDSAGNLASVVRPDDSRTDTTYDALNQPDGFAEYTSGGALLSTMSMAWNGPFGELSLTTDELGKSTSYAYDANGNLLSVTDHDGHELLYTYADGTFPNRVTRVELPTGDVTDFTYDAHGNIATVTVYPDPQGEPAGEETGYTYDSAGNLQSVTRPDGGVLQYAYDSMNRVTLVQDPNATSVTYSYNDNGCGCDIDRVTRVTLPGNVTLDYTYDGLGRMVSASDQDGLVRSDSYDAEGNVLSETRRDGATIDYTYDDVGRMVRKDLSTGEVMLYTYDLGDRLVLARDAGCELQFVHDTLGNVLRASSELDVPLGNVNATLSHAIDYTYDSSGNRLTMEDDTGVANYGYTYDDLHRLTKVDQVDLSLTSWNIAYDTAGRRISVVPESSGAQTALTYDLAGRLTGVTHATTRALAIAYDEFDGDGNVEHVSSTRRLGTLNEAIEYDPGQRVTDSTYSASFGDAQLARAYTFDAANRLLGDGDYDYTWDAQGRMLTRTPPGGDLTDHFRYDAEGRLVEYRQEWDGGGNPVDVLTTTYVYDPLGRRVIKDVNGVVTRYVYDGQDVLHEIDSLDRVARHYTHGPGIDDHLAVFNPSTGQYLDVQSDRLGSVVALSDASGDVVQEYVHDEFGNLVAELEPGVHQPFGYSGRLRDMESGLYYYRARMYDPGTGRFLTEDPLRLEGGLNFYTYVENNPVNTIDPSGLSSCPPPRCVVVKQIVCSTTLHSVGQNASVAAGVIQGLTGIPTASALGPGAFLPRVLVSVAQGAPSTTPNQSCTTITRVHCFGDGPLPPWWPPLFP